MIGIGMIAVIMISAIGIRRTWIRSDRGPDIDIPVNIDVPAVVNIHIPVASVDIGAVAAGNVGPVTG
jgi:hypothetical protein